MLATGGTLASAVQFLVKRGADHITCICLIAAPEGIVWLNQLIEELHVPCTLILAGGRREAQRRRLHPSRSGRRRDRLYGVVTR